jgi:DNA-binding MarR family transcriptional regulator
MSSATPAYLLGRFMFALDRASDRLLQAHVGISYRRFLFLTVLEHSGTVTQHELATALGYSDPAVSLMLVELAKEDYVRIAATPSHGRKRLVTITPRGSAVVAEGRRLLDRRFDQLAASAGVDLHQLRDITERLQHALTSSAQEENR